MLGMLAIALVPGCRLTGLAFRQDDRLQVVAPIPRSTVRLPVELRWTMTDDEEGSGGRRVAAFAVFVDRPPMPPGEDFDYFAQDDPQCLRNPACPDIAYLRARGIYKTTRSSLTLTTLPDTRPGEQADAKERHEISIALLDESDQRIGESALYIDFFLDRRG